MEKCLKSESDQQRESRFPILGEDRKRPQEQEAFSQFPMYQGMVPTEKADSESDHDML